MKLEQIIRQYVNIPSTPAGTGWYPVLHTACDHGKKGPRAGFKFEDDNVAFHCFNCATNAVYIPSEYAYLSDKMKQILNDFGVPETEYQQVVIENLAEYAGKSKPEVSIIQENIEPMEIPLPDEFYLLQDAPKNDNWAEVAKWYLLEERGVDPFSYPFMLSRKACLPHMKKWIGRIILPIYKDGRLIFYIGRDLVGNKLKKYESPAVSRDKILFGFDQLFINSDQPLYIVEGLFDALAIDGVAIIGNEISDSMAKWINKSRRKKVYIPDRFGDGLRAAKQALEYGWFISTPDISEDCKDMNDAVKKYGKLYVLKTLAEHTADGFTADVNLGIYCNT